MKKLLILISFLLPAFQSAIFGQITTANPYVENQYQSNIADVPIIGVIIGDDYAMVVFDYITSRDLTDGWISLSSKTTLTARNSNVSIRIRSWGFYNRDNQEPEPLKFDEAYNVKADRKYTFFMDFPKIPAGLDNISIRENIGTNEFYWRGIHINNPVNSSSNNRTPSYSNRQERNYDSSDAGFANRTPSNSNRQEREFDASGSGTGFAISSNGLVVTSYHVIDEAKRIQIRGVNGDFNKVLRAKVLAVDKINDLAVLKIDDINFAIIQGIPYMLPDKIADVGEDIFVLGYPLRAIMGDEIKLTNGLISSKSGFQGDVKSYQISAAVQPGSSGCPLFDKNGNVIGVVNARLFVESAAYAIKNTYLKTLLNSLDDPPFLPRTNILSGMSLSEQVKEIKRFVYIIETE